MKRLTASVVVGGRDKGLSDQRCRDIAEEAVRGYRLALDELYELTALERYYFQVDAAWVEQRTPDHSKLVRGTVAKARRRTSDQVLEKLTAVGEGGLRIKDAPPLTQHVDLVSPGKLTEVFEQYRRTLRADTALLLSQYTLVDYVLRVVGVGSVGTRCYLALFVGPSGEPLFLQAKEASPSVLESHGGHRCQFEQLPADEQGHQGFRVVAGQRILQAHSDRFLGWVTDRSEDAEGLPPTDFYFRQFRDMKGSLETAELSRSEYTAYVVLCAQLLARAHSQSPGGAVVAGYLGKSERFDQSVAAWSMAYADQTERDFAALQDAVDQGRVPAEHGI